jgi:hypothetical protein
VKGRTNQRRTSEETLRLLVPLAKHLGLCEAAEMLKHREPLRCWGIVQNDIRQHGYPTLPGKMAQPRRQVTCQEGKGCQPVKRKDVKSELLGLEGAHDSVAVGKQIVALGRPKNSLMVLMRRDKNH